MADQALEGVLSPYLRRQRLAAAHPHLQGRVLDYGCGSGALAALISADAYLGVETDPISRQHAQTMFARHRFVPALGDTAEKFDTVVALAVIEHVADPVLFLRTLAQQMADDGRARLLITTPHPAMDWIHSAGAKVGLFSQHASEEHETLLGRRRLLDAGRNAGLTLLEYSRFLFGANQLAIYGKDHL